MIGVEIDFVVKDSLKALEDYKTIFDVEVIEATNFDTGLNEVIFKISDTQFHMLDENSDFNLVAPTTESKATSIWFNVVVKNIEEIWSIALETGAQPIQPIVTMEEMGVSSASFLDQHGYIWMLHQIHRDVSFEEREEFLKKEFESDE